MAPDLSIPKLPMGYQEITKILPHRYPFLFIDQVTELVPSKRILAHKNVSANEPYVNGHFPELPVMPGVLQIEALAQAAGILAYFSEGFDSNTQVALLAGVDEARFRRPVVPGDRLDIAVEMLFQRKGIIKVKGAVTLLGQPVCEAVILAVIRDKKSNE